MFWTYLFILYY